MCASSHQLGKLQGKQWQQNLEAVEMKSSVHLYVKEVEAPIEAHTSYTRFTNQMCWILTFCLCEIPLINFPCLISPDRFLVLQIRC